MKSLATPLFNVGREVSRPVTPPQTELCVAAFFAGVGGIEHGLHQGGHRTILLCDNDPGAQAVLKARFPGVELREDVRNVRSLPPETTLLTAGFPCQDLSQAGLTQGISGSQSNLIGEVFRLLRRKRVQWVLLENVPFMMQLNRGRALEVIIRELEGMGYRWAYRVLDSRSFGLPQRRKRVFILASTDCDPRDVLLGGKDMGPPKEEAHQNDLACGFYWTEGVRGLGWAIDAIPTLKGGSTVGIPSPPAILMPTGEIILPDIRDAERLQGFRQNWTKPAEHVVRASMRWKLVGNAVSPPVAAWIGKRLSNPQRYDGTWDPELPEGSPWPKAAWYLGRSRYSSGASAWPLRKRQTPLHEFLHHRGRPLSAKAARGFRNRTRVSSLRFPEGFLDAVDAHLVRMSDPVAHVDPSRDREGFETREAQQAP